QEFGQQIETGGLVGTIRPDQSVNLALADRQIDAYDRKEAVVLLGQVFGFEDDILAPCSGHRAPAWARGACRPIMREIRSAIILCRSPACTLPVIPGLDSPSETPPETMRRSFCLASCPACIAHHLT